MSDLTNLGTWTLDAANMPPGVNCIIDPNTGRPSIVEPWTSLNPIEYIPCIYTYGDIVRRVLQPVSVVRDAPSSGGTPGNTTSGSSETISQLGQTTGTAYDTANATSPTLRCTVGVNGKLKCSASVSLKRTPGTATGETGAWGKWQYRPVGGSMIDMAAEVQSTSNAKTTANPGDPTMNRAGGLTVAMTKAGLTPGDYEARFIWRRTDVSGEVNNVYAQSASLTADGTVS